MMFYVYVAAGGLVLGAGTVVVLALGSYARQHWTHRTPSRKA